MNNSKHLSLIMYAIGFTIWCMVVAIMAYSNDLRIGALLQESAQKLEESATTLSSVVEENENLKAEVEKLTDKIDELSGEISALQNRYEAMSKPEEEVSVGESPSVNPKERLPLGMTNTLRCMDYRTITNRKSDQYLIQTKCYSDPATGIRSILHNGEVYYTCAMGDAYGEILGDTWLVTLKSGAQFKIMRGEFKDEYGVITDNFGHSDTNYDGQDCTNVIEFIFDSTVSPREVVVAGSMTKLPQFGGLYGDGANIESLKYLGRIDWKNL